MRFFLTTANMLAAGDVFLPYSTTDLSPVSYRTYSADADTIAPELCLVDRVHGADAGHVDCKFCEPDGRESILGPRIVLELRKLQGFPRKMILSHDHMVYVLSDD